MHIQIWTRTALQTCTDHPHKTFTDHNLSEDLGWETLSFNNRKLNTCTYCKCWWTPQDPKCEISNLCQQLLPTVAVDPEMAGMLMLWRLPGEAAPQMCSNRNYKQKSEYNISYQLHGRMCYSITTDIDVFGADATNIAITCLSTFCYIYLAVCPHVSAREPLTGFTLH